MEINEKYYFNNNCHILLTIYHLGNSQFPNAQLDCVIGAANSPPGQATLIGLRDTALLTLSSKGEPGHPFTRSSAPASWRYWIASSSSFFASATTPLPTPFFPCRTRDIPPPSSTMCGADQTVAPVANNNDHLVQSSDPEHPANLIPDLCRRFYNWGWVTGTGGGVSLFCLFCASRQGGAIKQKRTK